MNWLGTKVNEKLVSVGNTRLTEWGGHVRIIATREADRNKGYATSIVSELVKQILEELSIALIYVLSDNLLTIRVCKKVGFKGYRTYFFMRGERQ